MTNFERAMGRMNLPHHTAAPAAPPTNSDEMGELAACAIRIDIVIGVFAIGVLFGMVIA